MLLVFLTLLTLSPQIKSRISNFDKLMLYDV